MAVVNSQSQTQTTVSFYCTEMCEMNLSYERCAWYKYSSIPVLSVLRKFPLKKTITVGGGGRGRLFDSSPPMRKDIC